MALALALGAMLGAGQEAPDGANVNAPFKLAVVDLDEVLNRSEQWADCQKEGRALEDRMRRSLDKHEAQIRVLRTEYENLPPGTDAAVRTRDRLEAALLRYQEARGEFERQLRDQRTESLGKMFNEISAVIERYAQRHGIDLVLKKQDLRVSPTQPVELGIIVTTAHVLYARESYDITDAIVQELNARYPGEIREK